VATDFKMPSLGADMEAGTVVAWHKRPGEAVKRGDPLVDVETDKGTIEVETWETGSLEQILVEAGQKVPVGTVLARISPAAGLAGGQGQTSAPQAMLSTPLPPPEPARVEAAPVAAPSAPPKPAGARLRVTPLARRIAEQRGISLANIVGTGTQGAITRVDVDTAAARQPGPPETPLRDIAIVTQAAPAAAAGKHDLTAAMRHAIAAAVQKSKREIPHYYMQTDVCMDSALAWLEAENLKRSVGARLLISALLLRAVALAVREVPEMNGYWLDGGFRPSPAVHIGMAVSLRRGGLVAPAIHDVESLGVDDLMHKLLDVVARARGGKLRSSEVSDGTITVTSLGDTGVETVFGVIYPPQVAIVGFGKVSERAWAENGMVGARQVVTVTLSGDHRVSDGHRGGLFLAAVRRRLHAPETLFT
jgi:pyruvate dehydrogenase E2 component (dihydrolipoamide acetyltransferase)